MDHVVRIDGGNDTKTPIILHLLPGEETIFNLVVINDGKPSDVSLLASDPVIKAVRFRRSDDRVDGKQVIPIFARMPDETERLDGEIILRSSNGESRVPITILRDSMPFESSGRSSRSASSGRSGRPASRARIRDIAPTEEGLRKDYRTEEENPDADGIEPDMIDPEIIDSEVDDGAEYEDRDPYGPSEDQDTEYILPRDGQGGEDEKESGHTSFSKDTDLERYRSARRFRRVEDLSLADGDRDPERIGSVRERGYSSGEDGYFAADGHPDRDSDRIDRPLRGFMQGSDGENDPIDPYDPSREERVFQSDEVEQDSASPFGPEAGRRAPFGTVEGNQVFGEQSESNLLHSAEMSGEEIEEEDDFRSIGAMQIIPAVIFLGLVSALVLTFITESIPEFPGALVSSILIVTLIIYGAATLLKA